jgi:crotonobetainyl-CoA:carnitine CoA-transferase CaiB-like acyl-CoA transferase
VTAEPLAPPSAPVAADVASRLLRIAPTDVSEVDYEIEWAGPVKAPLSNEADVQAACGISQVHGRRYGGPTALAVDYASVAAGVLAAQGVLASALAGIPRVRTSVAQAALLSVSQYLAAATAGEEAFEAGGPPFTSADGVRFELETLDAEPWREFWTKVGVTGSAPMDGWRPFQQRFATAACPLPDALHTATEAADYAALVVAAREAGVSILPVSRVEDAPAPDLPPWRVVPVAGRTVPTPTRPPDAESPLAGLVVVEACRRVQGPLAGHLLGLLGATVTRIEPPGGDPQRGVPPMAGECSARFTALNRGKQVVELDITTPAGRRGVHELVAGADVFLHNWAPGKAEALALDADLLTTIRPNLVHAWASGWGDRLGPAPPLGTDYLVQAHSGLAALVGPDKLTSAPSLMTITDVLGGLVSSAAVLAGLLARARTGAGQRVDSSLLSSALLCREAPTADRKEPTVAVCTDLAELAADPDFADALEWDGCCLVRAPWTFR